VMYSGDEVVGAGGSSEGPSALAEGLVCL